LQNATTAEDVECGGPRAAAESRASPHNQSVKRALRTAAVMLTVLGLVTVCSALVWHFMGWMFLIQLILVAIVAYLVAGGGFRWLCVALKTAPRDVT
jgi:cation transporter-like permease